MIPIEHAHEGSLGGSKDLGAQRIRNWRASDVLLNRLEQAAHWLDDGFQIPGVGIQFGWDALAKLVPVFGDLFGLIASLILFRQLRRFGLPRVTLVRMGLNIGIDYFVGLIPIVGTIFDVFWKANVWNVGLLRRHLSAATLERARSARRNDYVFVIVASMIVAILLAASVIAVVWLFHVLFRLLPSLS